VVKLRPRLVIKNDLRPIADAALSTCQQIVQKDEESITGKEIVPYTPPESWTITGLALSTLSAPFVYTYYGVSSIAGLFDTTQVSYVVDLFTPKGMLGRVTSTLGICMGTFWGIQCAELVSRSLISKTIEVGCAYLGKSALVKKFITAGSYVIVGPTVETVVVITGAITGEFLYVMIGNVMYQLARHTYRELVSQWEGLGKKIEDEEVISAEAKIVEITDDDIGDWELMEK